MKISFLNRRLLFFTFGSIFFSINTFAIDTTTEEISCTELGFKPKTEKHGKCVLHLIGKKRDKSNFSNQPNPPKNSQEIQTNQSEIDSKRDYEELRRRQQQEEQEELIQKQKRDADLLKSRRMQEERIYQEQLQRQEQERIEISRKKWHARCSFEQRNAYDNWLRSNTNSCDGIEKRALQALCGIGVINGANNYAKSAYDSCMSGSPY